MRLLRFARHFAAILWRPVTGPISEDDPTPVCRLHFVEAVQIAWTLSS